METKQFNSEQFNSESKENNEKISSVIELHLFRHSKKESVGGKQDERIKLTTEGRNLAATHAQDKDIEYSIAFGSSRDRTQETAALVMGGKLEKINGEEELEELKEKLNAGFSFGNKGNKIGIDQRLNFNLDEKTEFGKKAYEAFANGVFLKFCVEESDDLAKLLKDNTTTTYSRAAGGIAEIVKKYLEIAPRWDALAQEQKDEEKNKNNNTLKRFFGTHQSIGECFLAKVIEKTKSVAERDAFVTALDNQGFGFVEGFNIRIETLADKTQRLHISFKKEKEGRVIFEYNQGMPQEIIESLIIKKTETN